MGLALKTAFTQAPTFPARLDASELLRGSLVSSRARFALYGDEIQSKAWNARLTPPIRPPDRAMASKRSSAVGRSALTACRSSLPLKFDAHVGYVAAAGRMQMITEVGADKNTTTIVLVPSEFVSAAGAIAKGAGRFWSPYVVESCEA
jgi:hypothetical protein